MHYLPDDEVSFIPVFTGSRDEGKLCDDCWAKVSSRQGQSLGLIWLVCAVAFVVPGAVLGIGFLVDDREAADRWMGALVSSGAVYGALAILATISVAVAVAAGQLSRDQRSVPGAASPGSAIVLSHRVERDTLNVGFSAEMFAAFTLGTVSGSLASMLMVTSLGDLTRMFAAALAAVVSLWLALECARLFAREQEPDPWVSFIRRSRVRSVRRRLCALSHHWSVNPKAPTAATLALLLVGLGGTALQCVLVSRWNEPLIWGITSLAPLTTLAVVASEVGGIFLLVDHRLWSPKVGLAVMTVGFIPMSFLAVAVGLLGSGSLPDHLVWVAYVVAGLTWVGASVVLVLILWGAAGYGVWRGFAAARGRRFLDWRCADNEPSDRVRSVTMRGVVIMWLSWLVLPMAYFIQVCMVGTAVGQESSIWLTVRALAFGLLVTAVGRLAIKQAGPVRHVLTGIALVCQFVFSGLLWIVLRSQHDRFALSAALCVTILVYLLLFGPWPRNRCGLVGCVADEQDTESFRRIYQSLVLQTPEQKPTCSNLGCVNCSSSAPASESSVLSAPRVGQNGQGVGASMGPVPQEPSVELAGASVGSSIGVSPPVPRLLVSVGIAGVAAGITWVTKRVCRHKVECVRSV